MLLSTRPPGQAEAGHAQQYIILTKYFVYICVYGHIVGVGAIQQLQYVIYNGGLMRAEHKKRRRIRRTCAPTKTSNSRSSSTSISALADYTAAVWIGGYDTWCLW